MFEVTLPALQLPPASAAAAACAVCAARASAADWTALPLPVPALWPPRPAGDSVPEDARRWVLAGLPGQGGGCGCRAPCVLGGRHTPPCPPSPALTPAATQLKHLVLPAGTQFVDVLKAQGILPGIKVDTGLQVQGHATRTQAHVGCLREPAGGASAARAGATAALPHPCLCRRCPAPTARRARRGWTICRRGASSTTSRAHASPSECIPSLGRPTEPACCRARRGGLRTAALGPRTLCLCLSA